MRASKYLDFLRFVMVLGPVTEVFRALERGDPQAADRLLPVVYDELRKLAAAKLARELPGQTLDATALVHEAYLRLTESRPDCEWDNRGHFFAAAAEAMRRILIDNARRKKADKHGGGWHRHELMETELAVDSTSDDLFAVDEVLARLATADPELARLVELRIYAGLNLEEAAGLMDISRRTAYRNWAYARAWLRRELDRKTPE